jgi:hypothetical protein
MTDIAEPSHWGGGGRGEPLVVPQSLRGYRVMTVAWDGCDSEEIPDDPESFALYGLAGARWESVSLRAICGVSEAGFGNCRETERGLLPLTECTCGIYNAYTPAKVTEVYGIPLTDPREFLFVSENRGQVVMGANGFRSPHTRLLAAAPFPKTWLDHSHWWRSKRRGCGLCKQQEAVIERRKSWLKAFDGGTLQLFDAIEEMEAAFPPDDVTNLIQFKSNN